MADEITQGVQESVRAWNAWHAIGAGVAALLGLRGAQVLSRRRGGGEDDLVVEIRGFVREIREEGKATRTTLHATARETNTRLQDLSTKITLLLDRNPRG